MRTKTDKLEASYNAKYKDDERMLGIVRNGIQEMRAAEVEIETAIETTKTANKNLSDATTKMEARVTELHEELKQKRN